MSIKKKDSKSIAIPGIGSEVDQKYLQSFYPKPVKDMKWVYSMAINVQGINVQAELIMEVTEIKGKNVTIKTSLGSQSFENTTTFDDFAPVPSTPGSNNNSSGFIFENTEDIVVPFGEYNNISKISAPAKEGRSNLWLAPGIGPIKFGIIYGGIPATLELKEFTG